MSSSHRFLVNKIRSFGEQIQSFNSHEQINTSFLHFNKIHIRIERIGSFEDHKVLVVLSCRMRCFLRNTSSLLPRLATLGKQYRSQRS